MNLPDFRFVRRLVIAGALFSILVSPTFAEPVRIANGNQPQYGIRTLALEEVWTLGGEESDLILGVLNRVLVDEDGNAYLLDNQLSTIQVVSPEGELLRTLGREGDGPGEFRSPAEMCFLPDGTLGVLQPVPGKVVRLNRQDGTPAGSWPLSNADTGGVLQMQGLRAGGDEVVVAGTHQVVDQAAGILRRDTFLAYVDLQTGLIGREITRRSSQLDLGNVRLDENDLAGGPEVRFDVLPDGRTAVAIPRNGYEISIFTPDGSLERVFTRTFTSWQRDEVANDIWRRILERLEQRLSPGCDISWETTEPDVQSLHVAPDGNIWIQNSRGRWAAPEGVFIAFDVFSAEGVYLEEIHFECPGDPRRDMLFFVGNNKVVKIDGFWDAALAEFGGTGIEDTCDGEPRPMVVTCYRIKS
jgi:hypothetical protein